MADEVAKEILGFDPDETFGQTDKSPNTGGEIQMSPEVKERFKEFVINGGAGVEIDETTRIVEDKLFVLGNSTISQVYGSEIERSYFSYDNSHKNSPFKDLARIHFVKGDEGGWIVESIWMRTEKDTTLYFNLGNMGDHIEVSALSERADEKFYYIKSGSFDSNFSPRHLLVAGNRVLGSVIDIPKLIDIDRIRSIVNVDLLQDPTSLNLHLDDSWKLGTIQAFGIQFK